MGSAPAIPPPCRVAEGQTDRWGTGKRVVGGQMDGESTGSADRGRRLRGWRWVTAGGGGKGLGGALLWRWQRGPSYAKSLCSLAPVQGDTGGLPAHPLCVAGAGMAAWGGQVHRDGDGGNHSSRQRAMGAWGEDWEGGILHSSCPLYKRGEKVLPHAFKAGLMEKLQGRDRKGGRIWGGGTKHPHRCSLLPKTPWLSTEGPRPTPQFLPLQHGGAAWTPNTPWAQQGPRPHHHPHT